MPLRDQGRPGSLPSPSYGRLNRSVSREAVHAPVSRRIHVVDNAAPAGRLDLAHYLYLSVQSTQ